MSNTGGGVFLPNEASTVTGWTFASPSWTSPVVTGGTFAGGTFTGPTFSGLINSDYKVLAATATYSATVTPATITGFSWTLIPGSYIFDMNLPITITTVGGLTISFALASTVLTSIQYQSYAATAADNGTAVSTQGTTTASGTKVFDSKTAAYTLVTVKGSMVVGTGGTFSWQGCQNTSAGAGDASLVLLGGYAKLIRVS
jgi:hypothetical protein